MANQTNPVQQRMEYLADLWNEIPIHEYRIICAEIDGQDAEMMSAFHWYMLGIDSPIDDTVIIFESEFIDPETFSLSLVRELEGVVNLWNEMKMPDGMEKTGIEWTPDYSVPDKNEAMLFVENMNSLAEKLPLGDDEYLVANLLIPHIEQQRRIRSWISKLLDLEQSPKIKILVTNITDSDTYGEMTSAKDVYLWKPDIDTPNVICQTASMGDPVDSGTDYRSAFMRMMKAIGKKDYKKTVEEGEKCIEIANAGIEKDPFWATQVVTVNIALSNEDRKYKNLETALSRADRAIKSAETVPSAVSDELNGSVVAQAKLNKAAILCSDKRWKEAYPLFSEAGDSATKSQVFVTAMEAYRMSGFCASKCGYSQDALDNLYKGFQTSVKIENDVLCKSTFPLLIHELRKSDYKMYLTEEELETRAEEVLGENWRDVIRSFKQSPDSEHVYENNPYITEPSNYQTS